MMDLLVLQVNAGAIRHPLLVLALSKDIRYLIKDADVEMQTPNQEVALLSFFIFNTLHK